MNFKLYMERKIFKTTLEKLTKGDNLTVKEAEYLFSISILLIMEYEKDNKKKSFFDFAYYLVLLVSISIKDYRALYDFSLSFGLYPITNHIYKFKLIDGMGVESELVSQYLENFHEEDMVVTYEQKKTKSKIIDSQDENLGFIAPTSFGKSSAVIDFIESNPQLNIGVIVPTKSLLAQTFRKLNLKFPKRNLYFHDEMFALEGNFIAVLTQERALRALKKIGVSFDVLIIDEAHKIFEFNPRSVLLSRLIKKNKKMNEKARNIYLSPLINNSSNLMFDNEQFITEARVEKNVKELNISLFDSDLNCYRYNRHIKSYFFKFSYPSPLSYILDNKNSKNFVFLRTPRKIERFSKDLAHSLPKKNLVSLIEISKILARYVHDDYPCVDYIQRGFLYIHGQMPDIIKEYLEYKFESLPDIDFLIANSVVLEGVNLPIDNLFMLDLRGVTQSDLINLIGRVNRLNEVFSEKDIYLNKLISDIHFVHCDGFTTSSMKTKIDQLKTTLLKDEIKNPLLLNYDKESLENDASINNDSGVKATEKLNKIEQLIKNEDYIQQRSSADYDLKAHAIESGVINYYYNQDYVIDNLEKKISIIVNDISWSEADVIEKLYMFFIKDLDTFFTGRYLRVARLKYKEARDFYRGFLRNSHQLNLKEHVIEQLRYQYSIRDKAKGRAFFIGESFGEIPRSEGGRDLYVDLSKKDNKDMVNIALIKIKTEGDFISYSINSMVEMLLNLKLITESEYNIFVYGTDNLVSNSFSKLGLSSRVVKKIELDGQLMNIKINDSGHIIINDEFKSYMSSQDDFTKFEMKKYIVDR